MKIISGDDEMKIPSSLFGFNWSKKKIAQPWVFHHFSFVQVYLVNKVKLLVFRHIQSDRVGLTWLDFPGKNKIVC